MKIFVSVEVRLLTNHAQAFVTIKEGRDHEGLIILSVGTSGLLSEVSVQELMQRAAEDALSHLEQACETARTYMIAHGLTKQE